MRWQHYLVVRGYVPRLPLEHFRYQAELTSALLHGLLKLDAQLVLKRFVCLLRVHQAQPARTHSSDHPPTSLAQNAALWHRVRRKQVWSGRRLQAGGRPSQVWSTWRRMWTRRSSGTPLCPALPLPCPARGGCPHAGARAPWGPQAGPPGQSLFCSSAAGAPRRFAVRTAPAARRCGACQCHGGSAGPASTPQSTPQTAKCCAPSCAGLSEHEREDWQGKWPVMQGLPRGAQSFGASCPQQQGRPFPVSHRKSLHQALLAAGS
jgi:hypothetical protein